MPERHHPVLEAQILVELGKTRFKVDEFPVESPELAATLAKLEQQISTLEQTKRRQDGVSRTGPASLPGNLKPQGFGQAEMLRHRGTSKSLNRSEFAME